MSNRPSDAGQAAAGGSLRGEAEGQGGWTATPASGLDGGSAQRFTGRALRRREDPDLLRGVGRYVGDVEPLPALVDPAAALAAPGPGGAAGTILHDDQGAPDNLAGRFRQQYGDVEAAFAQAAAVVRGRFVVGRCAGIPIECRGLVAAVG